MALEATCPPPWLSHANRKGTWRDIAAPAQHLHPAVGVGDVALGGQVLEQPVLNDAHCGLKKGPTNAAIASLE